MANIEEVEKIKAVGGIAPFGYAWCNGTLIVEKTEAPTRRLIYELFIKHRRKKTVAKLLNDLGYRTRSGALFSDTTIDRLLRDATAKGIRFVDGREVAVEAIVTEEVWQRANNFLGQKTTKQPVNLFVGFAFCDCGGKIIVPSNVEKYACLECRRKINTDDLEAIFVSQLTRFPIELGNNSETILSDYWQDFSSKEKRIIVEQICQKITVGATDIIIEFVCLPNSLKTPTFGQQSEEGNETLQVETNQPNQPAMNEPLMNEIEAAKFLGISRMTLLRRRNAGTIGFYRVGFRVLYSKEKHLFPFLQTCEK
jgi:site-specific DNA recombinase